MKTFLQEGSLHVEVTHDGKISKEGWRKIRAGLSAEPSERIDGRSVGIRNVINRLRLIFGDRFRFDIREISPGIIQAEMVLPAGTLPNIA